jgi:hypothetical protein
VLAGGGGHLAAKLPEPAGTIPGAVGDTPGVPEGTVTAGEVRHIYDFGVRHIAQSKAKQKRLTRTKQSLTCGYIFYSITPILPVMSSTTLTSTYVNDSRDQNYKTSTRMTDLFTVCVFSDGFGHHPWEL